MTSRVTVTAPCDRCSYPDATWHGHATGIAGGGDTVYDAVDCPACEKWTVRAQLERMRWQAGQVEIEEAS